MKKKLQIANGFFLVFTIIFNYVSNTGVFGGKTISQVSGQYHTLFTPAGYAFSIWGIIYLFLIGFVWYTGKSLFTSSPHNENGFVEKIGWWFAVSCIANCIWILTWIYDFTGLSVIVMIVLLIALLMILIEALKNNAGTAEKWLINIPFQLYAGWVSVALIAAVSAWFAKMGWNRFGLSEITWTIILIIIASFIHLFMTWKKNAPIFAFVAVWALVAIAVANKDISPEIYLTALLAAGIIFISSSLKIFKVKAIEPR